MGGGGGTGTIFLCTFCVFALATIEGFPYAHSLWLLSGGGCGCGREAKDHGGRASRARSSRAWGRGGVSGSLHVEIL